MERIFLLTLSNRYNKSHCTTKTTQTTNFYRRKEYFYLLFPTTVTLTPNYRTDSIRNFMYTKRNGENAILRLFFFIPQWQRIQPNFMYHTYQTAKQTNTTRTTNTTTPTRVSYSNFSISLFVHFIPHQFVHLINP